jgi:uncharacterized membrane protein HdeD (DUF308 family)
MAKTDTTRVSSALGLRGMLAILFGFAAVFWPGLTLVTLVYLLSAFLLASGLVTLVTGLLNASEEQNTVLSVVFTTVMGIIEIGLGVYLLRHVHVAFTTFILLIGFALIIRGLVEAFEGLFEASSALHRTAEVMIGAIAIVAGVVLLFQPESSGVAFVWILGLYALLTGPLMIALALDLNKR